jgi:hypothetical protein
LEGGSSVRPVAVAIAVVLAFLIVGAVAYAAWSSSMARGGERSGGGGPGPIQVTPVNGSFNLSTVLAGGDLPESGYGFCGPQVEYEGKLPASSSGTIYGENPSNASEVRDWFAYASTPGASYATLGAPGYVNATFTYPPGGGFYVTLQACDPFEPGPNDTVGLWLNYTAPSG